MTLQEEQEKVRKAVSHSLAHVQEDPWLAQRVLAHVKGEEPVRKKLSATMILVIVLVTVTTAALAVAAGQYFGWFDFYSEFYGVDVPEVARQVMKDSGEQQFTLGPVTFTVGELYCDGYTAMATAKVTLNGDEPALVTGDDAYDCIGINSEGGDEYAKKLGLPPETTWADAAKQLGMPLYLVDASLKIPEELQEGECMGAAMTGADGEVTCFSMDPMNGRAYGEKVDGRIWLSVQEFDEAYSHESLDEWKDISIFLEAPIDTKEYEVPENILVADCVRLDSVKAVLADAGVYVVTSFTAQEPVARGQAWNRLNEVEPVQADGEPYPWGLNLTGNIQDDSQWPVIGMRRMITIDQIPETLILTIPDAHGELTKLELKLKEE